VPESEKETISLFDYVKNPRSFSGDIDVVYTVPCTCAGVYRFSTGQGAVTQAGLGDLLHDWGTVVPKRTGAIEHDLSLLDSILNG
jgi:hypothetical protein